MASAAALSTAGSGRLDSDAPPGYRDAMVILPATDDLVSALRSGVLRAAGQDVTDPEPLESAMGKEAGD